MKHTRMQNRRLLPCEDFVTEQIIVMIDRMDIHLLAELMVNIFLVRKPDDFEALVLYFYMLGPIIMGGIYLMNLFGSGKTHGNGW